MKHTFYVLFITFFLLFTGCGDNEKKSETVIQNLNSTKNTEQPVLTQKATSPIPKPVEEYHYTFKDLKQQDNVLHIKNDIYEFKNIKQPIVIITIMSTWCPPCRGQIPHLSKLQQKFKENLFAMGILVYDDISKEKLNKFIIAQKMLFYLSTTQEKNLKFVNMITPKLGLPQDFPMPLTIVFVRGKYFTHYEGMIPEEMIESDINQLLKKIKQ
ncbi:MAG TPA: redoxin domain-containing protein [Campylobacterales bacterium]|nr:redoxin domain-containing protein [Campylobacterales bacterium]HHS91927.1 redoxin domain-containing protein [Campylobacterales bacterium]